MFGARAFSHSRNRIEQSLLAELVHLTKDVFQAALIGERVLKKRRLLLGEGEADGLRFDLAG